MANKMLIDAAHPEETRVVVVRGNRVEEFDFESASRRQLRGNIYLAKVTRVEPSLQAAFVDYGGNRHGFLAFSEIHPDYYQIPVADRQALIEAEQREIDEDPGAEARGDDEPAAADIDVPEEPADAEAEGEAVAAAPGAMAADAAAAPAVSASAGEEPAPEPEADDEPAEDDQDGEDGDEPASADDNGEAPRAEAAGDAEDADEVVSDDRVESVGAEDAMEEVPERRRSRVRQYKIQEVIKRRQVLLVQVVKEERGNKGAALTTYLSLAGRYSVLMPNTARGGGISRKITSMSDRKRLKQVVSDLEVPEGMGVILRTAGAARTRAEVKRDFEYLLRLWENVRELTLRSTAPALVYEEGSLIKRSIRDLYNKDIDEIIVAGDDAYREAKDFMRMLMPSHAKNVQPYKEGQPIFARYSVEAQLDAMFSPQVTLRSGGYMVINPTEALVSIDVNSGRSTREHNIEDTALQTNLEAAEEVARQLRLRDLAGLIVIDFIDMEEKRNNRAVERKLNDALKHDRARIQVGRISHFGLLEMSRQRIRTGVLESTTTVCPTCQGSGHVRAPSSVALHVLRSLEDQLLKGVSHHLTIRTRTPVALYILNQKRSHLSEIEQRFGLTITVSADETINNGAHFVVERGEPVNRREIQSRSIQPDSVQPDLELSETSGDVEGPAELAGAAQDVALDDRQDERGGEDGTRRRRRRRRRRSGNGGERDESAAAAQADAGEPDAETADQEAPAEAMSGGETDDDGAPRKRRRGRRGGRRSRRGRGGDDRPAGESEAAEMAGESEAAESEAAETVTEEAPADAAPVLAEVNGPVGESPVTAGEEDWSAPEPVAAADNPAPPLSPADSAHAQPQHNEVEPEERDEPPPPPEPAAEPANAPEEPDETAPKRSGWWQRRTSFF